MFKFNFQREPVENIENAIADLKRGSAEAFHILYGKYNQKVYRFCLRLLGDRALAEDAFQETFIKVFEHRNEFRGSNFSSWLFTIARNTCLNYIRGRHDYESLEEAFDSPAVQNETDVGMKEFIGRAIEKLPLALREALLLREYEECTYKEIAEILDIDISLAKVRVHRARLILRQLLKPLVKEYYAP